MLRTKTATGEDLYWRWPSSWPAKASWNSHVGHSLAEVEAALVDRAKVHDYMPLTTRRGIALNKILASHGTPVAVDYESSLQMSRLLDILLSRRAGVAKFPLHPQIWRSMDLPEWARSGATKEQHPSMRRPTPSSRRDHLSARQVPSMRRPTSSSRRDDLSASQVADGLLPPCALC